MRFMLSDVGSELFSCMTAGLVRKLHRRWGNSVDLVWKYYFVDDKGKLAVTSVRLEPKIVFSGEKRPTEAEVAQLHHGAHEECFIASSVLTQITVGGSWRAA